MSRSSEKKQTEKSENKLVFFFFVAIQIDQLY